MFGMGTGGTSPSSTPTNLTEPVILVGDDDGEVPLVPIPNTEVKLTRAQDSSLETARENR